MSRSRGPGNRDWRGRARHASAAMVSARVWTIPLVVCALLAGTSCSRESSWHDGASGTAASKASKATVTTQPGDGAANVSVLDPITVAVKDATIDSVSLTNTEGKQVAGELSPDKVTWKSTEPLGYDKRYRVAVAGTDTKGVKISKTSAFTTVKPANLTLPYLQANAGLLLESRKVFGVGQPIVVRFDEKIPDRATTEKALVVTTDPQVEGVWHWYTDQEVHWRPQEYWKPGTQVTVTAKVYGHDLGSGLYGQQDVSASFAIGDKKVAIADDSTLRISVYVNDQLTRTVATSMGKHTTEKGKNGEDLDLRTRSGVHVVLGTEQKTRMTGASWGLANDYDKEINYTTHISYQGEYIHEATWNVPLHGKQHDSHGCLNVGTQDAQWFMNNFIPGDIVEVKNSGIALANMDGLTDWNLTWEQWREGSALS